jgi:fumarate reductase subunit D
MIAPHRRQGLWLAFFLHRISGILLALFLPAHFLVLALALNDPRALDGFLHWTHQPMVRVAEMGLVFLLSVHLFGGLRLVALEWLPWSPGQKTLAALATASSMFVALWFLLTGLQAG